MSKGFQMGKYVNIVVLNRLLKERRDINVYHHANQSAHIISCNSSLTRGIKPVNEKDYLHISVESGPGHLKNYCVLDLPSFVDFKFSLNCEEITFFHSEKRVLLRVPPGPPVWRLKVTIPTTLSVIDTLVGDHVIIGDGEGWPEDLD